MTRGLHLLEAKSAILFMILTAANLISISSESFLYSRMEEDEDRRPDLTEVVDSRELNLIKRMSAHRSRVSENEENKQFLKYRHWYFKPRRKHYKYANSDDLASQAAEPLRRSRRETNPAQNPHPFSSRKSLSSSTRDSAANPSRQKRAYDYDSLFPPSISGAAPLPESKDAAELWNSRSAAYRMYHRLTGMTLQIRPDGTIIGESVCNEYCNLIVKSIDYKENKTMMKIRGQIANLYLAMKSNGVLYTTRDANHEDTNFLHEYESTSYDAYLSYKHRRFITMTYDHGRAIPLRARKISGSMSAPKRSLFLTSNASKSHKTEVTRTTSTLATAYPSTSSNPQNQEESASGIGKQSKPPPTSTSSSKKGDRTWLPTRAAKIETSATTSPSPTEPSASKAAEHSITIDSALRPVGTSLMPSPTSTRKAEDSITQTSTAGQKRPKKRKKTKKGCRSKKGKKKRKCRKRNRKGRNKKKKKPPKRKGNQRKSGNRRKTRSLVDPFFSLDHTTEDAGLGRADAFQIFKRLFKNGSLPSTGASEVT